MMTTPSPGPLLLLGEGPEIATTTLMKKQTRIDISLACSDCKSRNYKTTKRRDATVELKKFCKKCGTHTLHRETK
jgi:large subunit ribosomal protein L33